MTPTITAVRTRLLRADLSRPWGPDVRSISVIAVDVDTSDGVTGRGFSWTPSIGATAVRALLDDDIASAVIGASADPAEVWAPLWARLHEAGGGGLTTIAMAGLDLALWDAACCRRGLPLVDVLGRRRDRVRVYGSGVNLHYDRAELVAQAHRWVGAGFGAVKMKVGSPDLDDDIARVALVREIIGPDRGLRIDANQRWSLDRAIDALRELAAFAPEWIEEPLRAEDLEGHRMLRRRVEVPIAVGENLHTRYRFAEYLREGACDIVQPNVVRVGGLTPFLEIAALAREAGVQLAPHLLPEISTQIALSLPEDVEVEDVEDAGFARIGLLRGPSPVRIDGAWASSALDAGVGLGLRFGDSSDIRSSPHAVTA